LFAIDAPFAARNARLSAGRRKRPRNPGNDKTIPRSIVTRKEPDSMTSRGRDTKGRDAKGGDTARGEAKRQAILKGAKRVFLKKGFGAATMDAVAATARVSKMTVYRHFVNKEQLFAGLITDLCETVIGDDVDAMLQKSPEEALREFAGKLIFIVFAPDTVELHRIVVAECRRFPKLGRFFYTSGPERCIRALASYFERHRDHPRLRVGEPQRTAEEFLELLRGYDHLRILLGVERKLSAREAEQRIASAIRHVLR
jgi:TetR/AcrR family transcriptional regulator, mexJK operon transcriptional repressor